MHAHFFLSFIDEIRIAARPAPSDVAARYALAVAGRSTSGHFPISRSRLIHRGAFFLALIAV
ncbi:hypothetical protein [Dickeya dianthicola]|uniref:Uncharacterized protein n=1 Tax=Dickeya dianthicola TaxID=204039 RepID=A0AAX1C8Z0_9GAMM|nr:hypothetical protein [Dickeya dianthicola]ATO34122.1 hypothetical protein DDI_2954 [Dickeya dianthicola RNS04.9]MBT1460558.1 hypothetical protein [Dickeya dianthicola]MBT1489755.1 hypothetical protein [Dickeya dianthicola]MCA7002872.1 hypothetical protein [Dickeya dianthicola]MCI4004658.1 hypothetical protein [Dickeya dianthicola]